MNTDALNEMRVLYLAASAIIPLLESRHQDSYDKLLGEFRQGQTSNLARLAECNAYASILEDIKHKINNYEELSKENKT